MTAPDAVADQVGGLNRLLILPVAPGEEQSQSALPAASVQAA